MDPFEQLEMVWVSLQSWFDLLKAELDRVVKSESVNEGLNDDTTSMEPVDDNHGNTGHGGNKDGNVESDCNSKDKIVSPVSLDLSSQDSTKVGVASPNTPNKPNLMLPSSQTSVLAAAIVQSAPSHRRAAFLQPSSSIDQTSSTLDGPSSKDLKRRSWHVDRVTARLLSSMSPSNSLSQLPIFNRSVSTDTTSGTMGEWLSRQEGTALTLFCACATITYS